MTRADVGFTAALYVAGACLGALFFGQLTDVRHRADLDRVEAERAVDAVLELVRQLVDEVVDLVGGRDPGERPEDRARVPGPRLRPAGGAACPTSTTGRRTTRSSQCRRGRRGMPFRSRS